LGHLSTDDVATRESANGTPLPTSAVWQIRQVLRLLQTQSVPARNANY